MTSTFVHDLDDRGRRAYLTRGHNRAYGSAIDDAPYVAPSKSISVVACKLPAGIVRAVSMGRWGDSERIIDQMLRVVGALNPDAEWTGNTYDGYPYYLGMGRPETGIFMFRTIDWEQQTFAQVGELMLKPRGW